VAAVPNQPLVHNLLRIQEKRENLPLLRSMLEMLDQPTPQVLVKAKLVEITYSGKLEWGFAHTYTAPGDTFFRGGSAVFNPESYLNSTPLRPFQGGTFGFAFVGDSASNYGSLDSIIRLLKSKGRAEILGEPNILATQGQQARVRAGEKVPIQTANYQGNNIAISTTFEETGIELLITPELIGRDAVRLRLKETFSAVTGFVEGQGGTQNPVINRREAETVLTVRDGATLVVGGLQASRTIEEESGIPLLMDIPLLGWLFSSRSKEEVNTELYFIATPEIIRGSYSEGLLRPPGERSRLDRLGGK
jgi:type II secretory pathway component GspD/PulD (secretin)